MIKFTFFIYLLFWCCLQSMAQIQPSIYTGVGTVTNLGGVTGLGTEIKYNSFSISAAIGGPKVFSENNCNFDIGTKIYSGFGLFGGLNYGYVTSKGGWFDSKKDYYGFTLSIGYRCTIYKHIFGMAYLGGSSDYLTFMPDNLMDKKFIPRLGLI